MNVSYLAASTNQHIQPFMQLAETLGAMAAQLGASHVRLPTTYNTPGALR